MKEACELVQEVEPSLQLVPFRPRLVVGLIFTPTAPPVTPLSHYFNLMLCRSFFEIAADPISLIFGDVMRNPV